ncbi:uncharacterized protein PAC_14109 [Phialocephala subalpina]|uniref:Uncharacterized protein n=1 Tax=Phialocephala subalpina TaxID=576137 RepID=A0A1L7XGQ2_9HELO|nr:uncharacterized protein PAC_14109 [Phialocephala subalpina]
MQFCVPEKTSRPCSTFLATIAPTIPSPGNQIPQLEARSYQYIEARAVARLLSESTRDHKGQAQIPQAVQQDVESRDYQDALFPEGMNKDTSSELGSDDIATSRCEKRFSTKQEFYINMGSLAFDTRACPLLFTALLSELHPELPEKISDEEINDKGKKDGLGKLLVCFQVFWFMAQSIARLAQSLPIGLLEASLNAFAHCKCVMLIFAAWWHKPLGVSFPTTITGELYPETLVYMCMVSFSADDYYEDTRDVEARRFTTCREKALSYGPVPGPMSVDFIATALGKAETTLGDREQALDPGLYLRDPEGVGTSLRLGASADRCLSYYNSYGPLVWMGRHPWKPLSAIEIRRWQLAAPIFRDYPRILDDVWTTGAHDVRHVLKVHRCSNFEGLFGGARDWFNSARPASKSVYTFDNSGPSLLMYAVACVAGVAYGGIHALAWNLPFRTHAEDILWKVCTTVVMSFAFLFAGFRCCVQLRVYEYLQQRTEKWSSTPLAPLGT